MSAERWLPVVGWEGLYEVSDLGRVRSLARPVGSRWGTMGVRRGRVLKLKDTRGGYLRLTLQRGERVEYPLAHRLVATAFLGPQPEGMEVCHNDGDPANNLVSNLRWDTHSENAKDQTLHGTNRNAAKSHCNRGHRLAAPNLEAAALSKYGRRQCVACSRACKRQLPSGTTIQSLSDVIYAELVGTAPSWMTR